MKTPREFRTGWVGSLYELARSMWNVVHDYEWGPNEFDSFFDRVFRNTDDLETLWQLGGATNDYLRRYPGSFRVPIDLPRRLLASGHRDARIIGLKLFNRCAVPETEIVSEIVRALNRPEHYEEYGGLYETGNLIDRCRASDIRLPSVVVECLVEAIEAFSVGKDKNDQRVARHHIECLRSLVG